MSELQGRVSDVLGGCGGKAARLDQHLQEESARDKGVGLRLVYLGRGRDWGQLVRTNLYPNQGDQEKWTAAEVTGSLGKRLGKDRLEVGHIGAKAGTTERLQDEKASGECPSAGRGQHPCCKVTNHLGMLDSRCPLNKVRHGKNSPDLSDMNLWRGKQVPGQSEVGVNSLE